MTSIWDIACYSLVEVDVSVVLAASVTALKMEAVNGSETSINFCKTIRRNNPEGSRHIRLRENLKSHVFFILHKLLSFKGELHLLLLVTMQSKCDLLLIRTNNHRILSMQAWL